MADVQRWRDGREYRPSRETIVRSEFDVAEIPGDGVAREFVQQHHYSASYPAARERFGFYRLGELVGVAVFSHPTNDLVLTNTFGNIDRLAGVELVPGRPTQRPAYMWHVRRCGKGRKRLYAATDFDLLALVALDAKRIAYVPFSELKQTVHIRTHNDPGPGLGGGKRGKVFADFPFRP